jgi:hypothetical protein
MSAPSARQVAFTGAFVEKVQREDCLRIELFHDHIASERAHPVRR